MTGAERELAPWHGQVSAGRWGISSPRITARVPWAGLVRIETAPGGTPVVSWLLQPETTRSLAAWLAAAVGDAPPPADPDHVRAAIDEQRITLRERSAAPGTTEEARTELAWASRALDAVAAAASTTTIRQDT